MTTEEIAKFESTPLHQNAMRLRYWDDTAKVTGLEVPELDQYRDQVVAVASLARPF